MYPSTCFIITVRVWVLVKSVMKAVVLATFFVNQTVKIIVDDILNSLTVIKNCKRRYKKIVFAPTLICDLGTAGV